MAWLSTAGAWIVDSVSDRVETTTFFGVVVVKFRRTVVVTHKHTGALTYAAAQTLKGTEKAADPDAVVEVNMQNEAGAYMVKVVSETVGDWAPAT